MNLFDVAAILVLLAAVVAGIRTGALPQVGGISGAVVGLYVALHATPWLVDATHGLEPLPRALVVLGAIIGAIVVGEMIGSAIGHAIAGELRRGMLSGIDRALGGALGAVQALLIVWLAGGLLAAGAIPAFGRQASESRAVQALDSVLPPPGEVVGEIASALNDSGLPDVFVGLEPIPLPAVAPPTTAEADAVARAAEPSTARISTRACTSLISGTGVVVAPGYLVTNAHVVAGAATIRATIGSSTLDATPVLFDPDLDVAVLRVPGLDARPLRFAPADPSRGALGAALGYAGGGPLVVLPAAVTGSYQATGRDIYGDGRITRQILELRASVQPGDSGGPLVLQDGTIGGLVFAESRTDPGVGYALTPTEVAARIAPALGRTTAVGTGTCIR